VGWRRGEGNSGRRHRSYLLITTILLLWNVAASSLSVARAPVQAPAIPPRAAASGGALSETGAGIIRGVRARAGHWTIQQEYLIGKRIDINEASPKEISGLPGISAATAAAVVEERKRIGRFRAPGDLLRVKGIKRKRLEIILPFLAGMGNN
jgi:competence ComEA-like helix-hairpin-helix protein